MMKNWMTILMIIWMMRTLTPMELPQHPLSMQLIHMEVLWEVFWTLIHMDLQSLFHLQRNLLLKKQHFLEKCLTLFLNHHSLNHPFTTKRAKQSKVKFSKKTQPYPKSTNSDNLSNNSKARSPKKNIKKETISKRKEEGERTCVCYPRKVLEKTFWCVHKLLRYFVLSNMVIF